MRIVRRAVAGDAPALARIESDSPSAAGWGLAGFESEFRQERALTLVLEEDGSVAAFACARFLPPEGQLLNMACEPQSRRRGVATLLLNALFPALESHGCDVVTLEVRASNIAALGCYGKAGFRIVGRRPKFYNGTEDAILMDARLNHEK
ncbi:MAG: ribosomal protein S18-alanine N-acetyltransferase [Elusimicrobia bacterium]|nr:ribosomal protein S18-alanine N-acetyltransferase [Elusimicrobiota bacterium]